MRPYTMKSYGPTGKYITDPIIDPKIEELTLALKAYAKQVRLQINNLNLQKVEKVAKEILAHPSFRLIKWHRLTDDELVYRAGLRPTTFYQQDKHAIKLFNDCQISCTETPLLEVPKGLIHIRHDSSDTELQLNFPHRDAMDQYTREWKLSLGNKI